MTINWSLAFLTFLSGCLLLTAAAFSRVCEKSFFAPGVAMLFTWGVALVLLAFLPLIGFYQISLEALLVYVFGASWFAFIALVTSWLLKHLLTPETQPVVGSADNLNYKQLVMLWFVVALYAYPVAIADIMSFGSSIGEVSYSIRRASVAGETILNPILSNLFVLLGVLANVLLYGVVKKKVNLIWFTLLVLPYVAISLILNGRSGLVSLILGWMVIFVLFIDNLKFRYVAVPPLLLILVLFFGGVWVKKFDVEGQTLTQVLLSFAEHVFDYLYQGPILFSRYLTDEIDVVTNWDFLNSVCHMLSKFDFCQPRELHAEFAEYGYMRPGNVYSIYFSILPHYGLIGLFSVFFVYAIFLTLLFNALKYKSVFSLVVYPAMYSAIVLSVYKDTIGYSLYWMIKVAVLCLFLKFFFLNRGFKFTSFLFNG